MTTANKITLFRFAILPFFVAMVIFYGQSIAAGEEKVSYRFAALGLFALAAISDFFDGWVARKFNQQSPLGEFLDPLADKFLLLAGVVSLSLTSWQTSLPLWFGILVVTRDVVITLGWVVINRANGHVVMGPLWTSKFCTVFQFGTVCWVLLDFWSTSNPLGLTALIYVAAILTVITFVQYFREGLRQLREGPTLENEEKKIPSPAES